MSAGLKPQACRQCCTVDVALSWESVLSALSGSATDLPCDVGQVASFLCVAFFYALSRLEAVVGRISYHVCAVIITMRL